MIAGVDCYQVWADVGSSLDPVGQDTVFKSSHELVGLLSQTEGEDLCVLVSPCSFVTEQ